MYPRRQPSPPWPWATGPTRPTRSEPSLGRSELPRDRYTRMSQIEQVNSRHVSGLHDGLEAVRRATESTRPPLT